MYSSKSRLSALLAQRQGNIGLESDERPADAVETTETPAPVEETATETPAAEVPAEQTTETVAETVEVPAVTEEPAAAEAPAAEETPADDETVSTEGWSGAVKNYLMNVASAFGGGAAGAVAGSVAGPAGTVVGAQVGQFAGHTAWSRATAKKAMTLKKQIENISNRLADARNDDLAEAKKKGAKLKPSEDVKIDGKELLKKTLMGTFIPFYNAYQGHKTEELQKELDAKLNELKIILQTKGVATESFAQLTAAFESEGTDLALTDEEAAAEAPAEDAAPAEETPASAEEAPIVATEGEGDEVIEQTPAEDAAQGEAEQAAEVTADAVAEVPAEEAPAAVEVPAEEVVPAAEVPAETTPAVAEEKLVVFHTSNESEETTEEVPAATETTESGDTVAAPAEEPAQTEEAAPAAAEEAPAETTEAPAAEEPAAVEAPAAAEEAPVADDSVAHAVEGETPPGAEAPAAEETPAADPVADAIEAADAETPAAVEPDAEAPAEEAPAEEPVVATEDEDASAIEATEEQTPASDDSFVEMVEADREAESSAASLEELQQISAGLEAIYESLRQSVGEGGLQPQAAMMMNLAVESHTRRLGISQPVTASLENYGGMSQRTHATKMSMEGVGEVLKQVWETIVAAAKQLWSHIANFIKKVFAASTHLAEKAKGLAEKVKSAKGSAKTAQIEISQANANKLAVGETVFRDISKSLGEIVSVAMEVVKYDEAGNAALDHEHDAIVDAVAGGNGKAAAELLAKSDPVLPPTFKKVADGTHFGGRVEQEVYATDFVAGNVAFILDKVNFEAFGTKCVSFNARKFPSPKAGDVSELKIPTPSPEQMQGVVNLCERIAGISKIVEGMGSKLVGNADKVLGDLKIDGDTAGDQMQMKALLMAYRQRALSLNRASSLVVGHLVTTGRAALAVVEQALGEYETEAAAAPAADEPVAEAA